MNDQCCFTRVSRCNRDDPKYFFGKLEEYRAEAGDGKPAVSVVFSLKNGRWGLIKTAWAFFRGAINPRCKSVALECYKADEI